MKLKSSTLFAVVPLLALATFMTVNLAGCGGGGGGSLNTGSGGTTNTSVTANFQLLDASGNKATAGSVTLTANSKSVTQTASSTGLATFTNLTVGSYAVSYTATTSSGTTTTTGTITVTGVNNEVYALVSGTSAGPFNVAGTLFLNPVTSNTAYNNCGLASSPVTSTILVEVRDLNPAIGAPIIASYTRPITASGSYTIGIPYRPLTFDVEVAPAPTDTSGVQFAGKSSLNTFPTGIANIAGVNVCVNTDGVVPVPSPTATVIPINTLGTPEVTPTVTATPTAIG